MARRLLVMSAFGVAMGFLEAAVVVYLRRLYYPGGFDFPLVRIPASMAFMEVGREAATIVMLWAVAFLAGRTGWERFAWFSWIFGLWDLFYYLSLKFTIGWPPSLLTWDVLFLIPLIWSGPVLAPILVSLALMTAALVFLRLEGRGVRLRATRRDWALEILALLALLTCFMANHQVIFDGGVPRRFEWWLFFLAMVTGVGIFVKGVLVRRRDRRE